MPEFSILISLRESQWHSRPGRLAFIQLAANGQTGNWRISISASFVGAAHGVQENRSSNRQDAHNVTAQLPKAETWVPI